MYAYSNSFLYKLLKLYFNQNTTLFLIILALLSSVFGDYSFVQFNQNVILLPFWIMTCYYFVLVTKHNLLKDWILLAIVAALGMYSKFEIGLLILIISCFLVGSINKKFCQIGSLFNYFYYFNHTTNY